ncbi:MAG: hypothetical protein Q8P90_00380 [bacterium]|nr:hypothetical protein [bacterium]
MSYERKIDKKKKDPKQDVWQAYMNDFVSSIEAELTPDELEEVAQAESRIEAVFDLAVTNTERFKDKLADIIKHIYILSNTIIFSYALNNGIFIDKNGEIVVIKSQTFGTDFTEKTKTRKRNFTYEVLTGPNKGKILDSDEYPLWSPADR